MQANQAPQRPKSLPKNTLRAQEDSARCPVQKPGDTAHKPEVDLAVQTREANLAREKGDTIKLAESLPVTDKFCCRAPARNNTAISLNLPEKPPALLLAFGCSIQSDVDTVPAVLGAGARML
jgi:hypothetical protein